MTNLSAFLRASAPFSQHREDRERLRAVENAERAQYLAMSPGERAIRSMQTAYADVLRDSALVEASRQLRLDDGVDDKLAEALYARRVATLADSAAYLSRAAAEGAELARHTPQQAER